MSSETPATPSAAETNGDGKNQTAANVSQAQAIQRFIAADKAREASQTAETSAPEAQAPASPESQPAAEPETPDSPEAQTPETPEAPETESTEAPAPEAQADDVLSPESQSLDQKTKDKIQRRIDKEVGKRKALEAQLEQVKNQLTQMQQPQAPAPVAAPPAANAPLPDIKDPASLVEYRNLAKRTLRAAEEVLENDSIQWGDEGVILGGEFGDKPVSKDFVRRIKNGARIALEDHIPAKQEYFQHQAQKAQQREAASKQVAADFPFMADPNSDEYKLVRQWDAQAPFLREQLPTSDYFLALAAKGFKALQAEKAAKTAKPEEKPKPVVPKPKPPGDQAAVSTSGSAPRLAPVGGPRVPAKPLGNQTADSAARFLADRERQKQQR